MRRVINFKLFQKHKLSVPKYKFNRLYFMSLYLLVFIYLLLKVTCGELDEQSGFKVWSFNQYYF